MCTLRFRKPARENPNLGKPTKERFIRASRSPKVTIVIHLVAREHLHTPKLSHNLCLDFRAQRSLQPVRPTPNQHLNNHANLLLYCLIYTALLQQENPSINLEKCDSMSLDFHALLVVRPVWIRTIRPLT
jgi:hypothetical protein